LKNVTIILLIFQTALQLGLQPDHIRQAIRNNIQDIGRPFRRTDSFIQQILVEVTLPVEG
jgi:hypothetical protein